ncbi:excinuclease ABC subunit UvrC, partial [Leucobacter sp. M11]|uniref:excinuclease ABC subunit UvrC n=1 Tax=Leucobacter sp. M11 TaxID=2993565 RepID=UPI002D80915D
DQITAVEHFLERNAVVLQRTVNADVFGLVSDELAAAAHQFIIRQGRIRGERSWIVDVELDDSPAMQLEQVIQSAYDGGREAPPLVLVPDVGLDPEPLEQVLGDTRARGRVSVRIPERGEKAEILKRATLNAGENLIRYKMKRTADLTARTDALAELQDGLGMTEPPLRIECIDVSHLQGTNVVASLVVFEDGLPAKGAYRKYRIEETTDDTDSIYQVVSRRAAQLNAQDPEDITVGAYRDRPQLLIVDGGQPQVAAAQRALDEAGIRDVALCGVAKRLEELWLPNDDFPVVLPRTSEALFLVQRIRDEAHRFAITFQRQRRKTSISSRLEEVPGLGPKRVKAVLRHFGSVARLRVATVEELAAVPGIGPRAAETIVQHLADPAPPAEEPGAIAGAEPAPGGTLDGIDSEIDREPEEPPHE